MKILQKKKDRDFLILNFSDIHLRNRLWDNDMNEKIIGLHIMKTLIEKVKPDLITITGDISSPGQESTYEHLADFFDSFNIPWAAVWGNHDNEGGPRPVDKIEKIFGQRKNFVYETGEHIYGRGNYVILIEEEGRPVEGLIMMDAHTKLTYLDATGRKCTIYDKLTADQVDWYNDRVNELKAMGCNETAVFVHIPIFAYKEAFYSALLKGLDPKEIRLNESGNPVFWNKGSEGSHGVMHGRMRTHPSDDGMLDAILELGSTKTVICGHDHRNNFAVKYKGVTFVYTTKTGKASFTNSLPVGGTVLRISSNGVEEVIQEVVDVSELAPKEQEG